MWPHKNQRFLGEPSVFSVVLGDKLTELATLQWVKSMWALTCYHDTIKTDTAKHKSLWEQMNKNINALPRCNSILCHMWSYISLLAFIYLFYLFFPIVNSIKSHPPHSLCGLLWTRGREAGDWDVGERLPRMKNVLPHNAYEVSCEKEVWTWERQLPQALILHVCCCRPMLPVLLIF